MRIHIVAFTCLCTLITKDGQMFGYYPNASKTHLIQWRSVSVVRPWTKCTNGARGGGGGGVLSASGPGPREGGLPSGKEGRGKGRSLVLYERVYNCPRYLPMRL